jgi:Spy/CpxP family protein refolding chaperone
MEKPTSSKGDRFMTTKMKVLAVAALLALLCLPLAAQTAPGGTPSGPDANTAYGLLHHPRALARFLNLSADQTNQLVAFYHTLETTEAPLRQARGPLCQQLRTDIGVTNPDPASVGHDSIALYTNKQQLRTARQTFDTSFSAILNSVQLAQYDTLKALARIDNDPGVNVLGDCPPAT